MGSDVLQQRQRLHPLPAPDACVRGVLRGLGVPTPRQLQLLDAHDFGRNIRLCNRIRYRPTDKGDT